MKTLKVKELIQRLQCLNPDSDVRFYLGKDDEDIKTYAMGILNRAIESEYDRIGRLLQVKEFSFTSTPEGDEEYAAIYFEPDNVGDSATESFLFSNKFHPVEVGRAVYLGAVEKVCDFIENIEERTDKYVGEINKRVLIDELRKTLEGDNN